MKSALATPLVLAGLCAGCFVTPPPDTGLPSRGTPVVRSTGAIPRTGPVQTAPAGERVLYARDGSVVGGVSNAPRQKAAPAATPSHELGPDEGGRMYILELYQNVIEERDRLALENQDLAAALDKTQTALEASRAEVAGLRELVRSLEDEKQMLVDDNLQLAARLTTAQIRRLQSEKILLQSRIAEADRMRAKAQEAGGDDL